MRAFSKSRRIFWNALMDFIKEERSEMRKRGTSVEEKKLRVEEKGRAVALLPIDLLISGTAADIIPNGCRRLNTARINLN